MRFDTLDEVIDHVAGMMHAANLEHGGSYAADVEQCLAEGFEVGAGGRISKYSAERSCVAAQVVFLSRYCFIANGAAGPENGAGAWGVKYGATLYYTTGHNPHR